MRISETPGIIARYYEYLKWLKLRLSKYPRNERYVFGREMECHALSILEDLIRAYYQKQGKVDLLREVNIKLEIMRYHLRLSQDMDLLTLKQYDVTKFVFFEIAFFIFR